MIKLKVYVPPNAKADIINEDGFISLTEELTVLKLMIKLKIPIYTIPLYICAVNYKYAKKNQMLRDGDIVTFVLPIHGG